MSGSQSAETQRLLGELVASVRALNDKIDEGRRDRREAEERIREDFRGVNQALHLQRSREQVTSSRLELVENQQKLLSAEFAAMREQVEAVRGPMEELVSLRRRFAAIGTLILSITFVIWTIVGPVLTSGVQRTIGAILGWK